MLIILAISLSFSLSHTHTHYIFLLRSIWQNRWVNPNGDCYEGTFVYDARHGTGTYTWKNGNVYTGKVTF